MNDTNGLGNLRGEDAPGIRGRIPNVFAEKGMSTEWKFRRGRFVLRTAVAAGFTAVFTIPLARKVSHGLRRCAARPEHTDFPPLPPKL